MFAESEPTDSPNPTQMFCGSLLTPQPPDRMAQPSSDSRPHFVHVAFIVRPSRKSQAPTGRRHRSFLRLRL